MTPTSTIQLPEMAAVRQRLYSAPVLDVPAAVSRTVSTVPLAARTTVGDTVAVAVGSRGIDRLAEVVHQCIQGLKDHGLRPFLVPAMGSHGGGTADGQRAILSHLGITEEAMGAPLCSDMEAISLGRIRGDVHLFCAKDAIEADHLVVINRVKPHTKFSAPIESGICKMLTIGLGKVHGATEFHRSAIRHGFGIIQEGAVAVVEKGNFLFGLALIEDGYSRLAEVSAVSPEGLIAEESQLLRHAYEWMARIPFDPLDVLVVDVIGKNISGIGMDSNVTGRHRDVTGDFFTSPHIKRIFVRDLAPESDGNANGIGLADVTTRRLVDAIDVQKTYVNAIAAISPEKAAIPMHFESDRQAIEACIRTAGYEGGRKARIVRIRDTKSLETMMVSRALASEIEDHSGMDRIGPWKRPGFDGEGNLLKFGGV
ncbi:Iron-sulfur cluster-binding protein [Olavius algarvensis associated proteobacterium Delta 3]|nr:Iron-sulfur cluster-binding protein [Olavius algarvensis associated proteobacterium Delta 3]